jgi:small subunit ribosomal protein S6
LIERVKELITQMDGFLVFVDDWGERKLAYEIRKKERGYYVRFDYCGMASLVNEIERFFRIDDRALKYMTVLLDKEADLEKVQEEKAAVESRKAAENAPEEKSEEVESADIEEPKAVEENVKAAESVKNSDVEDAAAETTQLKDQEEA